MSGDFSAALRRLHERHHVRPAFKAVHPAVADGPQIVSGIVSSSAAMWPERVRIADHAFTGALKRQLPPLLYRHREVAGELMEWGYDGRDLRVTARVDLAAAWTANGFSLGFGPIDVSWFNVDDARTFFVSIDRVHAISEISVTPLPRDSNARVLSRRPVNTYDLALREVRRAKTLLMAA